MDQEKVTRVDFSLNTVRNTCIFRPRYLEITEITLKFKRKQTKTKTNKNKRIKHTNHKATLH